MPAQARAASRAECRGWIESRGYDLAFLALSPLGGLAFLLLDRVSRFGTAAGVLIVYFLGMPHYLSTFSFYLDDENRAHYRLRWTAYFMGPVLILSAVFLLRVLHVALIVQTVIFVWNIYHVSLQSAGILSIYRRLNGGDQREKPWAHLTLLAVNATMALWFVQYFPPLYTALVRVDPSAPLILRYGCLAVAIVGFTGYVFCLVRRANPVGAGEKVFLISSLLLFHPYLWMSDSAKATIAVLIGHFIQYLGIVWLLNVRKYRASAGSMAQRFLANVSQNRIRLVAVLFGIGAVLLVADRASRAFGVYLSYMILLNSLVLIHFYVDGLVWAFKKPFVRQTVGPYLALESHRMLAP
jgi:hypothetical protein